MATSKTLTPTNVTIQIPEFTDQPDQRVNSNCIDKEADAINALNTNMANLLTSTDGLSNVTIDSTKINTLSSGYSYLRKAGCEAGLVFDFSVKSGVTSGSGLFELPTGYRPLKNVIIPCVNYTDKTIGIATINTNGKIDLASITASKEYIISATYFIS